MKRILCVLITLFTFIGFQSNAQQIKIDIGSASGAIGDVVSIPVYVYLPPGSQGITTCQGAIVSSNPSVAEIVGVTIPANIALPTYITNPGAINFSGSYPVTPVNFPNNLMMTLDVKINALGCSDFDLTGLVNASVTSSVEFYVDGVIYDDLATDFIVDQGVVCSDCDLHINNLRVYPNNQTTTPNFTNPSGNSPTNYADYTSTCIPYNVAPNVIFNASQSNVYMAMYLDNNNDGIFEITILSQFNSAGILQVQFPTGGLNYNAGLRLIVSDQPITDPTAIPTCGEVEDYVFCGNCACDLNDIALGPFSFAQNTQGFCSSFVIQVPPVLGCLDVDESYSFYYEVFNSDGTLVYNYTTSFNGFTYDFPAEGVYTFVVTYTIIDTSGCEQNVQYTEDYEYTGCDCACDVDNLELGPFSFIQNTQGFCSSFVIQVPPVLGCLDVDESYSFYYEVFNSAGTLVYDYTTSLNGFTYDFPTEGVFTFVVTYTIVDTSGCEQSIQYTEDYEYTGCDCACDVEDLILGPFSFIQNTQGQGFCSSFVIQVPPVLGCLDVDESYSFYYEVFNSAGTLVYDYTTSLNGFTYDFPTEGVYTFVVTYTIVDTSGCEQSIQYTEDYEYIGCDCQLLGPPTFLDCQQGINPNATFHTLFWSAVPGASSYEVEVIVNDPTCCPGATNVGSATILPNASTSMAVPSNGKCYSWRVRSVCANGTRSAWSSKHCSCGTKGGDDSFGKEKSLSQSVEQSEVGQLHLITVPNPATKHVDITISGWLIDANLSETEMIIYDMTGKVVYRSEITLDETKRVDVSSFNSGVYIIKVIDNNALLSTEKLIIE